MEWRIFEGVPDEDVRAVLSLARRSTYRRGEVVFHRHDPADSMHLVTKGRFDVRIATSLGDEVALAIWGPGDIFGELAVLTARDRSATVTALEPGETLVVRGSELRRLARRHPALDEVLARVLAERVAFLSERIVEAYTVDAETRVARRVLELARVYGGSPPVVIPLKQDDLAALAGTSRATVNRVLRDAERRGLVELGRGRTVLLDLEGMARLARVATGQLRSGLEAGSPDGS
jgi:CRP-like cAMP-binding protein